MSQLGCLVGISDKSAKLGEGYCTVCSSGSLPHIPGNQAKKTLFTQRPSFILHFISIPSTTLNILYGTRRLTTTSTTAISSILAGITWGCN